MFQLRAGDTQIDPLRAGSLELRLRLGDIDTGRDALIVTIGCKLQRLLEGRNGGVIEPLLLIETRSAK